MRANDLKQGDKVEFIPNTHEYSVGSISEHDNTVFINVNGVGQWGNASKLRLVKTLSELESRIVNIHFDNLEKFVHDYCIDSSLEGLYESICENKIVNLTLSKDTLYMVTERPHNKAETMVCFAELLKKKGGCVVEIQTPIPSKITKDESGAIIGWDSCGFGLCRVTRLYIDNLVNMADRIDEFERAFFEEIYQKEQHKSA